MEQVEVLNEYYTNLEYDKKEGKELQEKISNIFHRIQCSFKYDDEMSKRLQILAEAICQNISFFSSIFKHIDAIFTILHYLTEYSLLMTNKSQFISEYHFNDVPCLLVITLATMCTGSVMHSFFVDSLIDTSQDIINMYDETMLNHEKHTKSEMIILEDSDLYAVINCLIITDQFPLYKIWVQKRVNEKFLWLMKNYHSKLSITIDTFQSVKDIQFYPRDHFINIVSIWSEDIVVAKNLALSINSHIVFINRYMDFHGGTVLLPYKHIFMQYILDNELELNIIDKNEPIDENQEFSMNVVHLSSVKINDISVGNLFYDGVWQKPIKGMYWKHNGSLWANATHDDIKKCYESARKGFKTWSIMPIKTRIQILSRFISVLKLTGKYVLATIVERWIKFPYLFNSIQGVIQNEIIEVLYIRKALSVIMLREENENILFFRLMQTLIAGNSVIVMFDANFCNLSSYYDMFSTCGIPPGVINLLSHENTNMLAHKLCLDDYTTYANRFFLKGTSIQTYIIPFTKLTVRKQIIIPLQ